MTSGATRIDTIEALEEMLSAPTAPVVRSVSALGGDIIVLGAGGKIGPSLCTMLARSLAAARSDRSLYAVSRFTDPGSEAAVARSGAITLRGDVLDTAFVASLPEADIVYHLVGQKFGTTGSEERTWANNCLAAYNAAARYPDARFVVLSTGNVYGVAPCAGTGSVESDPLRPEGDYAWSCVGRERAFQWMANQHGTRSVIIRLNYAVEMRYGVLLDIANAVRSGEAGRLEAPCANVIWQGDACAMIARAAECATAPATILNVGGAEVFRVADVARAFAGHFGVPCTAVPSRNATALITNAGEAHRRFGPPTVNLDQMVEWTSDWVMRGMPTFGKPTAFERTDGRF